MYSCNDLQTVFPESLTLNSEGFKIFEKILSAPIAIVKGRKIIKVSDSLCNLLGYSSSELYREDFIKEVIYTDQQISTDKILQDFLTNKPEEKQVKVISKLKELIACTLRTAPLCYNKEPAHLVIIKDYSQQKLSRKKQRDYLHFLENLDKIETAIRKAGNMEELLDRVLKTVLNIFGCDRAWLLFPCDPDARSFKVPMEVTLPQYPGAMSKEVELEMTEDISCICRIALESQKPVPFYFDPPNITNFAKTFSIKSQIIMAIYPQTGKPWLLGIHQCSFRRVWTVEDIKFFQEVAHRLTDSLSSLIFLNNLKKSEQKFRNYMNSAPDAILVTDKFGNYKDFNISACQLTGFTKDELLKKKTRDTISADTRKNFINHYKKLLVEGKFSGELPIITSNGEEKWCSVQVIKLSDESFLIFAKDISLRKTFEDSQKKLKSQLLHAQKMEAVGTLAGGIAHDFNNILSAIIGYTQLSLHETSKDNKLYSYLKKISAASDRAREMIKQIMTFSRRTQEKNEQVFIAHILQEVIQLIRPSLPSTIKIEADIEESMEAINANPSQLHQVIMNLCTNSFHAMSENGGTLRLQLKKSLLKNGEVGSSEREHQIVKISDTGYGIPGHIINRIFEPYFTTKNEGEGTGMGLAVTHGIITNMGGTIKVESTPGKGTVFTITIPQEPLKQPPIIESTIEESEKELDTGQESILLVDDEESITEVVTHQLKKMGYKVTPFTSSVKALDFFRKNPKKFDLVITDLTMPSITGIKLSKEIHKIDKQIPIILCTGYSDTRYNRENLVEEISALLQKPVDMCEFSKIIRSVLDKN